MRPVTSLRLAAALLAVPAASLAAQHPAAKPAASAAAAAATLPALTGAQQVAAAVLALPAEMRDGAAVLGYAPGATTLSPLRAGTNGMICLAPAPNAERFHVACYHDSLEPFMARGRSLRAEGVQGPGVDSVRFREIRAGTLAMPKQPAALYTLTGPVASYDPAAGTTTKDARWLYVVYMPGATAESTGLSAKPRNGAPWIMFPGTPKAHIMFTPGM